MYISSCLTLYFVDFIFLIMLINILLISSIKTTIRKNITFIGIINTILLVIINPKLGFIIGISTYFVGVALNVISSKKMSTFEEITYITLAIIVTFLTNVLLFQYLYNLNIIKEYILQPQLYHFISSVSKYKFIINSEIYELLLEAYRYQAITLVPTIIILGSGLIGLMILFISKRYIDKDSNFKISNLSIKIYGDNILIYGYMALLFFSSDFEVALLLKNIIYIVTILYFIQGCYVFDYLIQKMRNISYQISIYLALITMIILLPAIMIVTLPFNIFIIKEILGVLITIIAILGIVDSKINIRRLN